MYKYIIYHSDIAVIKLAIVNGGPTLCRYTVGPHMGGFSGATYTLVESPFPDFSRQLIPRPRAVRCVCFVGRLHLQHTSPCRTWCFFPHQEIHRNRWRERCLFFWVLEADGIQHRIHPYKTNEKLDLMLNSAKNHELRKVTVFLNWNLLSELGIEPTGTQRSYLCISLWAMSSLDW